MGGRGIIFAEEEKSAVTIERLNPEGMHSNPAYSHGVSLPASARIVLVGGQNGVDA